MIDYYAPIESCTAFAGTTRLASGTPREVARAVRVEMDGGLEEAVLAFDDATGRPVEFDWRGTPEEVAARIPQPPREAAPPSPLEPAGPRGPGRPRLGVVGREVTLLPRHWKWLAEQPGGASVTLRRLVEQARKAATTEEPVRRARDAAYRVMLALAGDEPGFEEATRVLFAGDAARFADHLSAWPEDVRAYTMLVAAPAFRKADASDSADA